MKKSNGIFIALFIIFILAIVASVAPQVNIYQDEVKVNISINRGGIAFENSKVIIYLCDASYNVELSKSTHYNYNNDFLDSLIVEC